MITISTLIPLAALLIAPARCLVCQSRIGRGILCRHCLPHADTPIEECHCPLCFSQHLQYPAIPVCPLCQQFPSPFRRQRFLWSYEGKARHLIVSMKYRPSLKLARFAGELLATRTAPLFGGKTDWDLIVPMPSSPKNYAHRLFNPAGIIAQSLSAHTGTRLMSSALRHTTRSRPQATQRERQRISNARQSLQAGQYNLKGASILLVDDVVTTGATGAVAARLLRQQGASRIELISLARASTWEQYRALIARRIRPLPCSPGTGCGITDIRPDEQ